MKTVFRKLKMLFKKNANVLLQDFSKTLLKILRMQKIDSELENYKLLVQDVL